MKQTFGFHRAAGANPRFSLVFDRENANVGFNELDVYFTVDA